ncbi:MAG: glycoside hydrolase family 3 C-terminal domain-containing protein [Lachnotalea sp.]
MTMEIEELKQDEDIDAILWTGLPGAYGFLGVADVLSGDINPSGHISDTYAVNSLFAPYMVNFGIYTYANSTQAGSKAVLTEENKADWYLVESVCKGSYFFLVSDAILIVCAKHLVVPCTILYTL